MSISPSTTFLPLPSPGLHSYDKQYFAGNAGNRRMHSPSSPGAISGFVAKLWSLLDTDQQWGEYIRWTETGEAFAIVDIDTFSQHVLPQAFKHDKFPSFVRQLNIYGFSRVKVDPRKAKEGKSRWTTSFVHPVFKRDHPEWLNQIKRKPPRSSRTLSGDKSASRNFSLTHPSGLMSEGSLDPELLDTLSPLTPDEPFFSSLYGEGTSQEQNLVNNLESMDYLSPLASPRIDSLEFSGTQSTPASWHGHEETNSVPHSDSTYGSISPLPTSVSTQGTLYQQGRTVPESILAAPSVPSTALEEKMTRLIQQNENLRQDVARLTNILSTAVFPEMSRIVTEQRNQANMQRSQQLMMEHFQRQVEQMTIQTKTKEEPSEQNEQK